MATVSLPFFGGELSSFSTTTTGVSEVTSANTYDTTCSRCALAVGYYYGLAATPVWASASTLWFHGVVSQFYGYNSSPSGTVMYFYNGSTLVAQVTSANTNVSATLQLQTLQSGVMTNVGSTYTITNSLGSTSALYTIDINLVAGSSGQATFYVNGASVASATGLNHSAWSGVTQVVLGSVEDTFINYPAFYYWSQVICDSTSTIGRKLYTDNFDTESATNTGWSGFGGASKVADVNEIALNDNTYIQAASSGLNETFYQSSAAISGVTVLGRGVAVRARTNDGGPANIKLVVRAGGANYTSPSFALTPGFTPITYMWQTNPATSGSWSTTAANAAELGVQSQT